MDKPLAAQEQRHFSPWLDQVRTCATCTHSRGTDGPHLFCQRIERVMVMPCGSWEREPGTDA